MAVSDAWKGWVGYALVFGLGAGLVGSHVVHAADAEGGVGSVVFGIVIPLVLAAGVVAGGGWLWQWEVDGTQVLRVGLWCLVGAAVLSGGALLTIIYEQTRGVGLADPAVLVVSGASGGGIAGFVIGVYDVRQRLAQRRAEALNQQLTVLNRVLRHDIRNSANAIRGYAEMSPEELESGAAAERISRQAAKLVEMGEHARTIERLVNEGGERQRIDVADVTAERVEQARLDHPGAEIDAAVPDGTAVRAHPLVGAAVGILLDNAVEHNDKETPRIEVELVRGADAEDAELRVADNGPGIPDDEVAVLERGYETPLEHGSGLGLWVVNWIVTESGGSIAFEENEPEGSVIRLRFERAGHRDSGADAATTPVERPGDGSRGAPSGAAGDAVN